VEAYPKAGEAAGHKAGEALVPLVLSKRRWQTEPPRAHQRAEAVRRRPVGGAGAVRRYPVGGVVEGRRTQSGEPPFRRSQEPQRHNGAMRPKLFGNCS
jgi:hypothetical protein